MAPPDWAPADRRSTPARLHCGKRRQLGKITAKAFVSRFPLPFRRGCHVAVELSRSRGARSGRAAGSRQRPAPDRPAQGAGNQANGRHPQRGLNDRRCRWDRVSRRHGRAVVRQYRLRAQRTRRGRRRSDAAALLFSAHRDERAGRGVGRKDQRIDGRRLPHLFRQLGIGSERGRLQDRPPIPEARASRRIPLQDNQPLLRLSRHDARHVGCRRHGRAQGKVRAVFRRLLRMCRRPIAIAVHSASATRAVGSPASRRWRRRSSARDRRRWRR